MIFSAQVAPIVDDDKETDFFIVDEENQVSSVMIENQNLDDPQQPMGEYFYCFSFLKQHFLVSLGFVLVLYLVYSI